jgi:hypothetical protein
LIWFPSVRHANPKSQQTTLSPTDLGSFIYLPVGFETCPAGLGRDHVFIPPARIVGMIAKEKEKRKKILTEQCGESLRRITRQRIQPSNKVIETQELKKIASKLGLAVQPFLAPANAAY